MPPVIVDPSRAPTLVEVERLASRSWPLLTLCYVVGCFLLGAAIVLLLGSAWQAHPWSSRPLKDANEASAPPPIHVALQPPPPQPVITKQPLAPKAAEAPKPVRRVEKSAAPKLVPAPAEPPKPKTSEDWL